MFFLGVISTIFTALAILTVYKIVQSLWREDLQREVSRLQERITRESDCNHSLASRVYALEVSRKVEANAQADSR